MSLATKDAQVELDVGVTRRPRVLLHIFLGAVLAVFAVLVPLGIGAGVAFGNAKGTWNTCDKTQLTSVYDHDKTSPCYHLEQSVVTSPEFKALVAKKDTLFTNMGAVCNPPTNLTSAQCEKVQGVVQLAHTLFTPGAFLSVCQATGSTSAARRRLNGVNDALDVVSGLMCTGSLLDAIGNCVESAENPYPFNEAVCGASLLGVAMPCAAFTLALVATPGI